MLNKELIERAFYKMKKGKCNKRMVKYIAENLSYNVDKMYDMLLNSRPNAEHLERGFQPRKHEPTKIIEHGKERIIYKPDIWEQWVHHIIMQVLSPILIGKFYTHSYGSIPKKGLHKCKDRAVILKKNYKWAFKLDIRHFFSNIRVNLMLDTLREFIKDEWFIYLIATCFKWHKKGLPLGFYLSQWLSNVYLNNLDYIICNHKGIEHVRYVDDIIMFGNNKRKLLICFDEIKQELGRLRLTVKDNYQLISCEKEPIDFLGFVITECGVRLRKNLKRRIFKVIKSIRRRRKENKPIWIHHVRQILSYLGWIKHSDSYTLFENNVIPYVRIDKFKQIVSKYERRCRNDEMGNGDFRSQPAYA